jgi:hypothetical protein
MTTITDTSPDALPLQDRARYGFMTALAFLLVVWLLAGPEQHVKIYLGVIDVLGASLAVAGGWSARVGRKLQLRSTGLVSFLLVVSLTVSFASERFAVLSTAVVMLLVALYVPVIVAIGLLRRRRIDLQLVLGAITIYLLTGIVAAMALAIAAQLQSTPVLSIGGTLTDGTFRSQVYMSFITLATVGYGDVTPNSGTARAIAVFTALFGQLYLVTAVASAVSLLLASSTERKWSK